MSETKWTPGTWETDKRGFSPTIDIIVRGETMVATVQASYADYDEERTAANARLIAMAPRMYETLKEIYEHKHIVSVHKDAVHIWDMLLDVLEAVEEPTTDG